MVVLSFSTVFQGIIIQFVYLFCVFFLGENMKDSLHGATKIKNRGGYGQEMSQRATGRSY
jgi:hypothetical protein